MAALASGAGVVDAGPIGGRGNGSGAGNGASNGDGGGGESITLADVKVGDSIAGQGAVKNGLFVPTHLGVMDPAAARQRRRRGAEGSGTPSNVAPPKNPATPATPAGVPQ